MSSALVASAQVRAVLSGERTVLSHLAGSPPMTLRETADGLMVVNSAGGPLRGDATSLTVIVGDGASLSCGSIAATVVQDGPAPNVLSRSDVTVTVGDGGSFDWRPKPVVVAAGANHVMALIVRLQGAGRVFVTEVLVLGRHSERPGRVRSHWAVDVAGRPVLVQDIDLGEGAPHGWAGPAVANGAKALVTALVFDTDMDERACERLAGATPCGEVLALAGGGVLLQALVDDTVEAEREVSYFAKHVARGR
ncbi:MAG: urease accessory protein UreD [Candidatus Nanopelagicales bacterium]